MTPDHLDRVFGRGRLKMVTGEHVEVFREAVAAGERRRYTKRFLKTRQGDFGQWTEREWRVRPRDQEKDSGMIEHLQNAFRASLRPRVIKRGPEIQPQHCQSENDCADKKTVAAGIACSEEQHGRGD